MGIKLQREKPRQLLTSVLYRLLKLPLPDQSKLKLFLNLEWIFQRLSHEMSFRVYDSADHAWRQKACEFILDFIEREHTVLDLGCSSGEITHLIATKAKSVVGIDHDKKSIDAAQKAYSKENLNFICADAIDYLKSTQRKFDVLILSHVLEHIDEPERFLQEFRDSFRYFYIEVPDFDMTILNHYRKKLNLPLVYSDNDHVREFDRFELQELFLQCHLRVTKSEFIFGVQRYWCEISQ